MKKLGFLTLSLFLLTFTVACDNTNNNSENNNQEQTIIEEKKETKVSCSGPMLDDSMSDISGIVSDNMVIYATYDKDDKLTGVFYDYDFNLSDEFEGESLKVFKEGLDQICKNDAFSDCKVNVDGKKANVHAKLDLSESEGFDKETFKDEMKLLGSSWTCTEE